MSLRELLAALVGAAPKLTAPGKDGATAKTDSSPVEKAKTAFGAAAGATTPTKAAGDSAGDTVREARARYDAQTTWTVGALGAVGVLVFGSLPFTNAVGADLFAGFPLCIGSGLALAALGIGIVVWARSRSLEPQDASLGELVTTLERVEARKGSTGRVGRWLRPTHAANADVAAILCRDPSAHLGPGVEGDSASEAVRKLIEKIGDLEAASVSGSALVAGDDARRSYLAAAGTQLGAVGVRDPAPPPWRREQIALIASLRVDDIDAAVRRRSAEVDAELAVYLGHRHLLLNESALAQVKGAFRAGRRLLLLGGLLTLLGAALYTSTLPADGAAATPAPAVALHPAQRVRVAVRPTTTRIDSACRSLEAVLLEPEALDDAIRDGPATVFVYSPPSCTGQLPLAEDEADLTPIP